PLPTNIAHSLRGAPLLPTARCTASFVPAPYEIPVVAGSRSVAPAAFRNARRPMPGLRLTIAILPVPGRKAVALYDRQYEVFQAVAGSPEHVGDLLGLLFVENVELAADGVRQHVARESAHDVAFAFLEQV